MLRARALESEVLGLATWLSYLLAGSSSAVCNIFPGLSFFICKTGLMILAPGFWRTVMILQANAKALYRV